MAQFLAKYIQVKDNSIPVYYRTVRGDSVNEAIKQANLYAKKSFICANIVEQIGKD